MYHYMPQIFWHDRQGLLSVDIHPQEKDKKYKIVTSSVQKEIRIWDFEFETQENSSVAPLSVHFVANLEFHNQAINQVKFSPSKEQNVLASGDCEGRIAIWTVSENPAPPPQEGMPANKENWVRKKVFCHESDVNALCWSPDGLKLASVSNDHSLSVHEALTGKLIFSTKNFRSPNGVFWDPQGKYIITMSPDRRMDIVDAAKGTRLKHFSAAALPARSIPSANGEIVLEEKIHKLFHDDQLFSFQRALAFSPNGEFIAAPCAHLELGSTDLYGTYFFKREDLAAKDAPFAFYPSPKPTFLVRFSPLHFDLLDTSASQNHLRLPYRLVWICLNKDAIYFYDSQHTLPVAVVDNIHLNALTDASWSPDGQVLVVSSLEGYCSFIRFGLSEWGEVKTEIVPMCASPKMIEEKKKKRKSVAAAVLAEKKEEEPSVGKSPMRPAKEPATPKSTLKNYFGVKKDSTSTPTITTANGETAKPKSETEPSPAAKKAKRIQLFTID